MDEPARDANDEEQPAPRGIGGTPIAGRQVRRFLLRLWCDPAGELHGAISEPGGPDDWRATFGTRAELFAVIAGRFVLVAPTATLPHHGEQHE